MRTPTAEPIHEARMPLSAWSLWLKGKEARGWGHPRSLPGLHELALPRRFSL